MAEQTTCSVQARYDALVALRGDAERVIQQIDEEISVLEVALRLAAQPMPTGIVWPEITTLAITASMSTAAADDETTTASPPQTVPRPRTHVDILVDMARADANGEVHLTTAAKEIIRMGFSEATIPGHITSTMHARLSRDPRWAKVGRGTFRLMDEQEGIAMPPAFIGPLLPACDSGG